MSSTSGVVSVSQGTCKRRRVTPQPQEPSDKRKSGTPAADQARKAKFKSASASTPGALQPSAVMCKTMATKLAKKNEHVIGTSLESMVKQRVTDPDSTTLLAWVKAIAHGGLVKCNGRKMALQPGLQNACNVKLSPEFVQKHVSLA